MEDLISVSQIGAIADGLSNWFQKKNKGEIF